VIIGITSEDQNVSLAIRDRSSTVMDIVTVAIGHRRTHRDRPARLTGFEDVVDR
jgi:hypothetical protein